jgi:hypothetical protein
MKGHVYKRSRDSYTLVYELPVDSNLSLIKRYRRIVLPSTLE